MDEAALTILRLSIGALLTYAAVAKIRAGRATVARAIAGYRILSSASAFRAAPALVASELGAGLGLIFDLAAPWSAVASAALLSLLTVALVDALLRGRRGECGCGGVLSGPIRWPLIARNASLIAGLLFLVAHQI